MPVGCLGQSGPRGLEQADSTLYLHNGVNGGEGSEASRQADKIAVMQQTLLVQIFRVPRSEDQSSRSQGSVLTCPTCATFAPACCQLESGWSVLAGLVTANSKAVWNPPLVKAVNSLSFQGYICPGILVTLTDEANLLVLEQSWQRQTLLPPPGFKIFRLGLSGGCTVKPFDQGQNPSLPDAICAVLWNLKQTETVANMDNIIGAIKADFQAIPVPRDFVALVHRTLGALIKARRVYYTGKGYFLVIPESNNTSGSTWLEKYQQFSEKLPKAQCQVTDVSCQTEKQEMKQPTLSLSVGTNGLDSTVLESQSPYYGLTRVSPASKSPRASPLYGTVNTPSTPSNNVTDSSFNSEDSPKSSPRSPNLERSQSFRLNKKSQKMMAKGGSLRISKKESLSFKEDTDNIKNEEAEDGDRSESPSPKKMERKNSVLARMFGRGKKSSRKEILTFSGQFPPPDLVEHMRAIQAKQATQGQAVETQTPNQQRKKSAARPALPTPPSNQSPPVSISQVRNGPNGNFVMYERADQSQNIGNTASSSTLPPKVSPMSPNLSLRPLPKSPPPQPSEQLYGMYGTQGNIYSQPNMYSTSQGPTKPPPAYNSAPPYRPKQDLPNTFQTQSSLSPTQNRSNLMQPQTQTNGHLPLNNKLSVSPQKQVHFAITPRSAERDSPKNNLPVVPTPPKIFRDNSPTTQSRPFNSSPSGQNLRSRVSPLHSLRLGQGSDSSSTGGSSSVSGPSSIDSVLYDDTLVGIEVSNQELESRLQPPSTTSLRPVDTIHNNRHLDQEIIYEENLSDLSRSSSVSTLKPYEGHLDHPSLQDLGSIADLSAKFQSLTARKLIAGLSISSIDTLLEVNAAHDSNNKLSMLNESTETIDFGVI